MDTLLKKIISRNQQLLHQINELQAISSDQEYLLRLTELLNEFGPHPALISLLVVKLQLQESLSFDFKLLEDLMMSSLQLSGDSDLLKEFYFYIEKVLQTHRSSDSRSLFAETYKKVVQDLDDIRNDQNLA